MMRLGAFLVAAFVVIAAPAFAQSTKDRLAALERAVSELQAAQPASMDAAMKISRLEQDVQALTGRVEELTYKLQQANARLDAVSAALANENASAAGAATAVGAPTPLGAPGAAQPPPAASSDPIGARIAQSTTPAAAPASRSTAVELPLDTEAAFQYASDLARQGDYPRAQAAFELFLKTYPKSARAPDAQFRLGEIFLATGAHAQAADAFLAHIRTWPNDRRSAEAYLKLGQSFSRLGRKDEACKVLKATKAKFTTAAPAILQRVDLEMARAACK